MIETWLIAAIPSIICGGADGTPDACLFAEF